MFIVWKEFKSSVNVPPLPTKWGLERQCYFKISNAALSTWLCLFGKISTLHSKHRQTSLTCLPSLQRHHCNLQIQERMKNKNCIMRKRKIHIFNLINKLHLSFSVSATKNPWYFNYFFCPFKYHVYLKSYRNKSEKKRWLFVIKLGIDVKFCVCLHNGVNITKST